MQGIEKCRDQPIAADCWGSKNPSCMKPVIVPNVGKPQIMLVTEQMAAPCHISKDWNPNEDLIRTIRDCKNGKVDRYTIPNINRTLYGRFLQDFDDRKCAFSKFYWTHFIKCPGDLRNKKKRFNVKGLDYDACANAFLTDEIRAFRPGLIITMGKYAGDWVLRKANYPAEWIDFVKDELRSVFSSRKQIPTVTIENITTRLVAMPHPSGQNPLSIFNKDLQELIKNGILDH